MKKNIAFVLPVVAGKEDDLRKFSQELETRKTEFAASRERAGVKLERSYLQQTPMGSYLVVYAEGNVENFGRTIAESKDPFDTWFLQRASQIHGIDVRQMMSSGKLPSEQIHNFEATAIPVTA